MMPRLYLFVLLAGCSAPQAGQSPDTAASEGPASVTSLEQDDDAEPLASVDDAAKAFEAAEDDLDQSLLSQGLPEQGIDAEEAEAADATRPKAAPMAADRCSRACRALGSMRRSADRLCELTGRDDPRCQNVEQRLVRARDTVARSCPGCDG